MLKNSIKGLLFFIFLFKWYYEIEERFNKPLTEKFIKLNKYQNLSNDSLKDIVSGSEWIDMAEIGYGDLRMALKVVHVITVHGEIVINKEGDGNNTSISFLYFGREKYENNKEYI